MLIIDFFQDLTMRPGGHRPTNLPERKINGLPTPQNLRFCQDGQFSALWNVNDSTVQMTTPDMLIGFQAQFITLSGVYTMEMNRFDSFTHYRNWAPEHPPSVHQRKLLRKYLYFVLSQWPEEDVQGPFPSQTGNPSTSSRPIINQIPASGMNIKTATLRQILVDHGQNAAPGQHVSPDHPPRTNNLLTVNSPHSLHPGSIYAAPPPPRHQSKYHSLALRLYTSTYQHKCPYQGPLKLCRYPNQSPLLAW